jgi:hypothetical protein
MLLKKIKKKVAMLLNKIPMNFEEAEKSHPKVARWGPGEN